MCGRTGELGRTEDGSGDATELERAKYRRNAISLVVALFYLIVLRRLRNEIVAIKALCANANDNEPKIVVNEMCLLKLNLSAVLLDKNLENRYSILVGIIYNNFDLFFLKVEMRKLI